MGACALVGVAAVAAAARGDLASVARVGNAFGASNDRPALREGRWGSAFDRTVSGASETNSMYSLGDGKRGTWAPTRGVNRVEPSLRRSTGSTLGEPVAETRARQIQQSQSLRSAPALTKSSEKRKWDRAPYEYEMPRDFAEDAEVSPDPRDAAKGVARKRRAARTRPPVARTPRLGYVDDGYDDGYDDDHAAADDADDAFERRFVAAELGDASPMSARASDAAVDHRTARLSSALRSEPERVENDSAELGNSEPSLAAAARDAACALFSEAGGPNRDETLCQKYANDARMCQVYVSPTQSCFRKTVGDEFLDPRSASQTLGARGGRGPATSSEDSARNALWRNDFYDCMAGASRFTGSVEAPYRLPLARADVRGELSGTQPEVGLPETLPLVSKWFAPSIPNTAYFWNFVHIPKAGGTYFKSLLHASEIRRQTRLGGLDPRWDEALLQTWVTKPLVDLTEHSFANVVWRYASGKRRGEAPALADADDDDDAASPQFTGAGMKESYDAGHRAVSKGSLSMGACDDIDAPCAYVTVLRDPVERFMSHYAYGCLEGSENKATWDPEWIEQASEKGYEIDGCPASPVEFHARVGDMNSLLAPGADPSSTCAVEAAKRNLRSPCVRFLLLDEFEDGLAQMRRTLPDFADIGAETVLAQNPEQVPANVDASVENVERLKHQAGVIETRRNRSGDRLTLESKRRLERYAADEEEMNALKALLAGEIEVYRYATETYHEQWDEPLRTC